MNKRILLACAAAALCAGVPVARAQKMSCDEMEQFLRRATIVSIRDTLKGVTRPKRATLESGSLKHDANIQTIDQTLKNPVMGPGSIELNIRDYWGYNIAGYELAKILQLNMVPPYVERRVEGYRASVSWWVPDVMMDEGERLKRKLEPPDPEQWNRQMAVTRIYSQLVYNADDNVTNFLVTKDWRLWMIDFSRAFRPHRTLRNPENLTQCDRRFLENMRRLSKALLEQKLRPYLTRSDIAALLARRDKIVKFFDDEIARKGEAAVLFELNRMGEACGTGL